MQASDLGVSHQVMAYAEQRGLVERIIPGVYVGAEVARDPLIEAAAWTLRFPRAVIALLTAAVHHELTDAFARGTWLFVPVGTSRPRSRQIDTHVVQTDERFIAPEQDEFNGILALRVHGVAVRITGPDRTVLDLWRYPARISPEYALEALRRRAHAPDFEIPAFARLARRLRVWTRIEPVVQGLVLR